MTEFQVPQLATIIQPAGPPTASIVIVGECPGSMEEKYNIPFTGRSGQLLRSMLQTAGILLSDCYLTYIIKTKSNSIVPYYSNKQFTPAAEDHLEILKKELASTTANVIVAVGATACHALIGRNDITKVRGSIYDSSLIPGRKVIPILSPSFILQGNYISKLITINDLFRIKADSTFPELNHPDWNYIINPSPAAALSWLEGTIGTKELCYDIEVDGSLQINCIGFSTSPEESICIPVATYNQGDETRIWLAIAKLLEDESITKIGQNVIFDAHYIAFTIGILSRGPMIDTMVGHNHLYPDFKKGLDYLTSIYTRLPYYKDEGKDWRIIRDYDAFYTYNAKDVSATHATWHALHPMLEAGGYMKQFLHNMEIFPPCMFMMWRGTKIDREAIVPVRKDIEAELITLYKKLDATVESTLAKYYGSIESIPRVPLKNGSLVYLNPLSPTQLKTYFYAILNIPPYKDKGKPSCNDKALQRLAKGTSTRQGLESASLIQKIRILSKFLGTYLEMKIDEDSRFRASYNPRGTIFGRLSSSKTIFGTGMNDQNIPEKFKGFFVADEEYLLVNIDKKGAEWVATAFISGDPNMMRICNEKLDPHTETAHLITGVPRSLIVQENDGIGHESDINLIARVRENLRITMGQSLVTAADSQSRVIFVPRTMSIRQAGKKSNHGFNYGMGARLFALINEVSDADALLAYNGYHTAYTYLKRYYEEVRKQLSSNRTLTNCFGRKIRLLDRWENSLFMKGYAFNPQSTVADIVLNGMLAFYNERANDVLRVSELQKNCHDSIQFQIPYKRFSWTQIAEALHLVVKFFDPTITYHNRSFIIESEIKIGFDGHNMTKIPAYDNVKRTAEILEDETARLQMSRMSKRCTETRLIGES